MSHELSQEAAERMIMDSIGDSVTIHEVLQRVFGRRRTQHALTFPDEDPEVIDFGLKIEALVNRAWKQRGISRRLGPYLEL